MPKHSDYKKAFLYKLVCNDIFIINIYVGSSTNWVKRKANHKHICNNELDKNHNSYKYQFIRENGGWDNWSMIKICDFPCNSKLELETEERRYIELLKADLNKVIPTRSRTGQQYYIDNKEKIAEYAIANKERIVGYKKDYYAQHIDEIRLKNSITIVCQCGVKHTNSNTARHFKSKQHQNFLKKSDVLL